MQQNDINNINPADSETIQILQSVVKHNASQVLEDVLTTHHFEQSDIIRCFCAAAKYRSYDCIKVFVDNGFIITDNVINQLSQYSVSDDMVRFITMLSDNETTEKGFTYGISGVKPCYEEITSPARQLPKITPSQQKVHFRYPLFMESLYEAPYTPPSYKSMNKAQFAGLFRTTSRESDDRQMTRSQHTVQDIDFFDFLEVLQYFGILQRLGSTFYEPSYESSYKPSFYSAMTGERAARKARIDNHLAESVLDVFKDEETEEHAAVTELFNQRN